MIHLLVGPDRYLIERELRRILAELDPDGLNSTRFDKSTGVGEIGNAVATSGFFGTGRVIIAEGVMARASGNAKAKQANSGEITQLFSSVAPGNTLVLVDPDLQTVPAAIRKAAGPDANQFGGVVPRGHDIVEWVQGEARQLGSEIEARNVRRLLERLYPGEWQAPNKNPAYDRPPDLQTLISEITKLATAANGNEITARDIDELVPTANADDLFPLIDSVVQGNAASAFTKLHGQETDDDSAARVLNQLVANAEIGQIAVLAIGESALVEAGKKIGQSNPRRLAAIQRTFSRGGVESFANQVLESDRRLKTGYTRSLSEQLHDVIIRRAQRTRDR